MTPMPKRRFRFGFPWRLLGPHWYYDVVRLARRGRSTVLRVLYILALFGGLCVVYLDSPRTQTWDINAMARVSEGFAYALFSVQNLAILVLTPAYLGSAIAEERERRTLELLFTTQLSDTQIVLGKFVARIVHLIGFVLAGLPIVSLVQFWGGVDFALIVGNLAYTVLLILSVGSLCLLLSTLLRSVTGAVLTAYAIVLPSAGCCLGTLHQGQLVLQDASSGVAFAATVQGLWIPAIPHGLLATLCLVFAVLALRDGRIVEIQAGAIESHDSAQPMAKPVQQRNRDMPAHGHQPAAQDVFGIPYTLPPIQANVLLWKERYVGGPSLFWSPIVWVPLMPFIATGVMLFIAAAILSCLAEFPSNREAWERIVAFFYWFFLAIYIVSVSFRAAASVAHERQQQTLEPLLLLPIERREILIAKWLASLLRAWPWAGLMLLTAQLGPFLGLLHPFSAVMLCLAPWPMIACFASLGLLLSVSVQTVLRAYLVLVLVLVLLIACNLLGLPTLSYLEAFRFAPGPAEINRDRFVRALQMTSLYALLAGLAWIVAAWRFNRQPRGGGS